MVHLSKHGIQGISA